MPTFEVIRRVPNFYWNPHIAIEHAKSHEDAVIRVAEMDGDELPLCRESDDGTCRTYRTKKMVAGLYEQEVFYRCRELQRHEYI